MAVTSEIKSRTDVTLCVNLTLHVIARYNLSLVRTAVLAIMTSAKGLSYSRCSRNHRLRDESPLSGG
jgi:hypothetical protein